MNEFDRIARIQSLVASDGQGVVLGIGDDAAVLERPAGPLVLSVDAAVEGVHFRLEFGPARTLGRRSAVAALSDLAAMGAVPRGMLSNIQLPANFPDQTLEELVRGQADAAREFAAPIVGGNLCAGQELAITTTVVGEMRSAALTRAGAKVGDLLCCSGIIGAAALGLHFCSQARTHEAAAVAFVDAFLHPTARIALGQSLCGHASACVDISDGLLQDLQHLCKASAVGARVDFSRIPVAANFEEIARQVGLNPAALCLGGGEDYELLFTLPSSRPIPNGCVVIGHIVSEKDSIQVVDEAGHQIAVPSAGYKHFNSESAT